MSILVPQTPAKITETVSIVVSDDLLMAMLFARYAVQHDLTSLPLTASEEQQDLVSHGRTSFHEVTARERYHLCRIATHFHATQVTFPLPGSRSMHVRLFNGVIKVLNEYWMKTLSFKGEDDDDHLAAEHRLMRCAALIAAVNKEISDEHAAARAQKLASYLESSLVFSCWHSDPIHDRLVLGICSAARLPLVERLA